MKNIVILGGGFGGIRAALDLDKKLGKREDVKITLIDRNNFHTFTPLLYEVASAHGMTHRDHPFHAKLKSTISIPLGRIFKGKSINTVQAEIKSVDLENGKVTTGGGNTLEFDYLIIGLGSSPTVFGVPGAAEYAYKFKTVQDAVWLYDKIEETYDKGARGEKRLPINFIVVGGGFTGVELAAELSLCTTHAAHRHKIYEQDCSSIILAEAGPQILSMASPKEAEQIKKHLTRLGVGIMEQTPAEEVGPDWVKTANGLKLSADLVIWTAGIRPPDILQSIKGLNVGASGYIKVNCHMQAEGHKNVFAIGDIIEFADKEKTVPKMAYTAADQGAVAAENIVRLIKAGERNDGPTTLKNYKPFYDVWVAPIGGRNAFVHLGPLSFKGPAGYLVRQLIDLRYYLSILPFWEALKLFKNEVSIFVK